MKVIILASESEAPLLGIPAAQAPIDGEPVLLKTLRWLVEYDVTELLLAAPEQAEAMRPGLEAVGPDVRIHTPPLDHTLGTAGMLRQVTDFADEPFALLNDKLLLDFDLAALRDYHQSRNALITVALVHTEHSEAAIMVECESGGRIVRWVQRPANWTSEQRTANGYVYIVEPELLDRIPDDRPVDWEAHLLPLLVTPGEPVYGQLVDGTIMQVVSADDAGQPSRES